MNATYRIDGVNFDLPPKREQILALAQLHKQQLHDALHHQEQHLGERGIEQRLHMHEFTALLDAGARHDFEDVYDHELQRLAEEEHQHVDPEADQNVFDVFMVCTSLAVMAGFLYMIIRPYI